MATYRLSFRRYRSRCKRCIRWTRVSRCAADMVARTNNADKIVSASLSLIVLFRGSEFHMPTRTGCVHQPWTLLICFVSTFISFFLDCHVNRNTFMCMVMLNRYRIVIGCSSSFDRIPTSNISVIADSTSVIVSLARSRCAMVCCRFDSIWVKWYLQRIECSQHRRSHASDVLLAWTDRAVQHHLKAISSVHTRSSRSCCFSLSVASLCLSLHFYYFVCPHMVCN